MKGVWLAIRKDAFLGASSGLELGIGGSSPHGDSTKNKSYS